MTELTMTATAELTEADRAAAYRGLTRAQRDAYDDMMKAREGEWRWASQNARRFETLEAVVNAGLAEWRSSYPEAAPHAQHYIVPVGTPTHEQVKAQREAQAEARLLNRAAAIMERAGFPVGNHPDTLTLVAEIIRDLTGGKH